MDSIYFNHSRHAAVVWNNWKSGREKLEKILNIQPPVRLLLLQSFGQTAVELDRMRTVITETQFRDGYVPIGCQFLLTKIEGEGLPEQIQQNCIGLPWPLPDKSISTLASFNLAQVPSCCGLCLSWTTVVPSHHSHKGIGTLMMELKEKLAFGAGYSRIMGTLIQSMQFEERIWDKFGWEKQKGWVNTRTGNSVIMGQKHLTAETAGVQVGAKIVPVPVIREVVVEPNHPGRIMI